MYESCVHDVIIIFLFENFLHYKGINLEICEPMRKQSI